MTDLRHNLANSNTTSAGSAELALRRYLPPRNGKTSAEQLKAITWQAVDASSRAIRPPLTYLEREEAHAQLLEIAVRCIIEYDPTRDTNSTNVPLNIRFTAFAITRMRQRFIDWLRTTRGDTRPGRTQRQTTPIDPYLDDRTDRPTRQDHHADAFTEPDFADHAASRIRIERWQQAADLAGIHVREFVLLAADTTADDWLTRGAAA